MTKNQKKIMAELEWIAKENQKQNRLFATLITVVSVAIVLIAICFITKIL